MLPEPHLRLGMATQPIIGFTTHDRQPCHTNIGLPLSDRPLMTGTFDEVEGPTLLLVNTLAAILMVLETRSCDERSTTALARRVRKCAVLPLACDETKRPITILDSTYELTH